MRHILALLLFAFYSYAYDAFITPEKLNDMLKDERVILLDVSNMYDTSHIKGALHADVSKFIKSKHERLAALYNKNVQKEIIALGINPDSHIVIYSRNSYDDLQNSTYLAFALTQHGFENISILEGGYMAWVFKYHTLVSSKKSSAKKKGSFTIKYDSNLLAEHDHINHSQNTTVVESDYRDNFFDDLTLRHEDELSEFASNSNLSKNRDIVVYDETIFKASVNWYIIYKKLGFKNAKIARF